MTRARGSEPMAIVLGQGGIEIVRALSMSDVPCGVVTDRDDPARWSRLTRNVLTWDWAQPPGVHDGDLAGQLVRYGRAQTQPPVLICCSDQPMLFLSRFRDRLAGVFRFVIPDSDLVEALADKARFYVLAGAKALPVPQTCVLHPNVPGPPAELTEIDFPIIVKPTMRDSTWLAAVKSHTKALRIEDRAELLELWPRLRSLSGPIVAQQCIDGPENAILSYHVYVDERGLIAGEFTGRKVRTMPEQYGQTCALTITDDPQVMRVGREVTQAFDMRGVAKLDFKQAPDGRLYLLEINARLSLWNHPGARAGVNLPAMMYADLTGRERPQPTAIRTGLSWVHPKDFVAARRAGLSIVDWMRWAWVSPTKAFWRWDDPLAARRGGGRAAARRRAPAHADPSARGRSRLGPLLRWERVDRVDTATPGSSPPRCGGPRSHWPPAVPSS